QFVVRYFVRFFLASLTASVYERSDARFVQQSRLPLQRWRKRQTLLQGLGSIFTGEKACRKLKKSLRNKGLRAAQVQVKVCKWLLRLQGVRSNLR
ncbi:hypothetical protein, partial [Sphaerotilus uruguayifluvii]|uniref:hypothetical protein n=1 Tax=Sphaerotilus uruguayifluvii TaxID=2735897 RepID=UPI001C2DCB8F